MLTDYRPEGEISSTGWVTCRCKNHKNLRWTMKDPRTAHRRISNNPQVMYDGDIERPEATRWPFGVPDAELQTKLGDKWTWECECPFSDLEVIASK